jgi:hypothetical protein
LRIFFAQNDGQELEGGVFGYLLGKIFFADQVEDKVRLGDEDAAKCNGEGEEGRQ